MALRVEIIGSNDKLVEAVGRYGIKPGTGPKDASYMILLMGSPDGEGQALEALLRPETRGGLIVAMEGSRALGASIEAALEAGRRGRRVAVIQVTGEGVSEDWMLDALRGLRAAASASDMTVLLYGFTEEEARALDYTDTRFYEPGDAVETLEEAMGYGGLYIGTYLAEYYPVEGLDEDLLSRSLGAYLALRSVLESSGANAVLVNCSMSQERGANPMLAIHLLLDEGVPAACRGGEDLLHPQMLSLALTGKPPATGRVIDYRDGILEVEPHTVPTLVAGARMLAPNPGGYEPRNKLKPGAYTLASLGPGGAMAARVEANQEGDLITLRGAKPWDLPSTLVSLAPGGVEQGFRWAFYFLGLAPLSPPIPLS